MIERYKYPKTPHLPYSLEISRDDKALYADDHFKEKYVIVTEKLDGENTTISKNYIHARSLNSGHHPSRAWVKNLHGSIAHLIPENWRVCGENMYARHSIYYDNLDTYFYVFNIWDEKNEALSWNETVEWCNFFGLYHVPVLYHGVYDKQAIEASWKPLAGSKVSEGFVIRVSNAFHYNDFSKCVAKHVRKSHVKTNKHWTKTWVPNKLKNGNSKTIYKMGGRKKTNNK